MAPAARAAYGAGTGGYEFRRAAMEIMVDSEGLEALADSAVTTAVGHRAARTLPGSRGGRADARRRGKIISGNRAYAEALHVLSEYRSAHGALGNYLSAMANSGTGQQHYGEGACAEGGGDGAEQYGVPPACAAARKRRAVVSDDG